MRYTFLAMMLIGLQAFSFAADDGNTSVSTHPRTGETEEERKERIRAETQRIVEEAKALISAKHNSDFRPIEDNVLINIKRIEYGRSLENVRHAYGRLDRKHVQGGRNKPKGKKGGLTARVIGNRDMVGLTATAERASDADVSSVSLMTQVGRTSSIRVIKRSSEILYPSLPIMSADGLEARTIENITGTGLRIKVVASLPHAIILDITPYFYGRLTGEEREPGRSSRIYVNELAMSVSVIPGQPIVLGGYDEGAHDATRAIFSAGKNGNPRSTTIILTATPHAMMKAIRP